MGFNIIFLWILNVDRYCQPRHDQQLYGDKHVRATVLQFVGFRKQQEASDLIN